MFMRFHKFFAPALFLTTSLFCATALADDCEDLNNNPEWTTGMVQLQAEFNLKDYDAVLSRGEDLSYLCARSPELNYYIGKAYAAKGSTDDALVYLGIAGDAIADIPTSPEIVRDIYYTRYEIEHPNSNADDLNALKNENARIEQEKKTCQNELDALKNTPVPSSPSQDNDAPTVFPSVASASSGMDELKKPYREIMWAGIGIGIGGVVLTSIGGGLAGSSTKYSRTGSDPGYRELEDGKKIGIQVQKYRIAPGYLAGWTFIGAGIAATITGVVLASVYGIKLNHLNDDISFNISPMGFDFSLKF